MKSQTVGLIASVLFGMQAAAQAPYQMVFQDEFEGDQLDTNIWEYMIGNGQNYGNAGWGNNESQYYTSLSSNVNVSGGSLNIIARQQNYMGYNYTSARIRTQNNLDIKYGKIEARMKLPSTQGIWPAFWMLPTNSPYGGWAAGGEIDIMESINVANTVHGTLHFGGQWPNNTSAGGSYSPGVDFSADFHTYTIEWEPDTMRWYVDGTLYRSLSRANWWSSNAPDNDRAPFDHQFHLLLNCAVGGNWPGYPNGSSVFPQQFQIDYIRVYQRVQAPFGGTAAVLPGVLEAEEFDEGYPGDAYFDCDIDNNGGAFRTGVDVDIEAIPSGGFNVGYICAADWMEYTVDVQTPGEYNAVARVASDPGAGAFRIERDGTDLTGAVNIPATGGWQTYVDVPFTITLQAGVQTLRLQNATFNGDRFNIDRITFESAVDCVADTNGDGVLSPADFSAWVAAFNAQASECDQNGDGSCTPADFSAWVANYNAGC
ncbi:MAG: family 16 glycosylhydrolase [Phycisphaerales bacterium]|nr:family 16 glycosylhydrolase [Phycisphaerales bacterium]MCB9837540.1 family 16 glycosylhydrolase [Phycisphaera sp.]